MLSEAASSPPTIGGTGIWGGRVIARLEQEILPAFVPTCRWFGGKGRTLSAIRVACDLPLGSLAAARIIVIEVSFTAGSPESYLFPLVIVGGAMKQRIETGSPRAVVARFGDGRLLCDAVHSAEARAELLRLLVRKPARGAASRLVGVPSARLDAAAVERIAGESRVVGADQSNTALIYGDAWFLKIFRKLERGPNPDVDILQFLSETRGFEHSPPFGGALKLADSAGDTVLAMVSAFTPNRGDGWSFSLDAVRKFFRRVADSRLRFSAAAFAELTGDAYPRRVSQLGRRTGELHLALACGEDRADFAAEPYTMLHQRTLHRGIRGAAGRVLRELRRQLPMLPEKLRAEAEAVVAGQARLEAMLGELTAHRIAAQRIRIHGDYHLGQVLNTGKDFVILDFEGEPRRSLDERILKRSPLVDVAGMLRSFDYAASATLRECPASERAGLERWARAWVDAVQRRFLESYLATVADASFLPGDPADVQRLLRVFTLEKALYEIGYELSYRPDFLAIPLGAVSRLLAGR